MGLIQITKEDLLKIITEAVIHGGDPGGPYYCNEENLTAAIKAIGYKPVFNKWGKVVDLEEE